MAEQKYHIGKNGPAVCNAHPERSGGRSCRLGGPDGTERHGSLAEVTVIWEGEQESLHGDSLLSGQSRSDSTGGPMPHLHRSRERLSNHSLYEPIYRFVDYPEEQRAIAMRLALLEDSPLSYAPIAKQDKLWESEGTTVVERYELEDGSVGYFKGFRANGKGEALFGDYGTTSLGASINEVNAYRMAKAMGPDFEELVPETVFREAAGKAGTIQREVSEDSDVSVVFNSRSMLRTDYRNAALFDFVIGNQDRHESNFLYGVEEDGAGSKRSRIRLIDNSFSFPSGYDDPDGMNTSAFTDNDELGGHYEGDLYQSGYALENSDLVLRPGDRAALNRARQSVRDWIEAKTISADQGCLTVERIDHLLEENQLSSFTSYFYHNLEESGDYDL